MQIIRGLIAISFVFISISSWTFEECKDLYKVSSVPFVELELGQGAGGTVLLLKNAEDSFFVKKIFKSEKSFKNDLNGLKFLAELKWTAKTVDTFQIIDFAKPPDVIETNVMYFKYYPGFTVFDYLNNQFSSFPNSELTSLLVKNKVQWTVNEVLTMYNQYLENLDKAILSSGQPVLNRSEFPLYGAKAVHYVFKDFQLVIHVKKILISQSQIVLIDPH